MSAFSRGLDVIYQNPEFAVAAIYTPPAGAPVAVTIRWTRPDDSVSLSGMATRLSKTVALVRAAEIADPQKGAGLTAAGTSYTLGNRERSEDRLEWILDLKEA